MAELDGSLPEVYVQPGEVQLVDKPAIMRTLLGSCVGIDDAQLDAGEGPARGAQKMLARTAGIVVLVGQADDGSARLGHPIDLGEAAPDHVETPDEDVLGDGGRSVEDGVEARKVGLGDRRRRQ